MLESPLKIGLLKRRMQLMVVICVPSLSTLTLKLICANDASLNAQTNHIKLHTMDEGR